MRVGVCYECAVRECVCGRSSKIPVYLLLLAQDPFSKFFERVWVCVGVCYECAVRECVGDCWMKIPVWMLLLAQDPFWVATIRRLLKISGVFRRIQSLL